VPEFKAPAAKVTQETPPQTVAHVAPAQPEPPPRPIVVQAPTAPPPPAPESRPAPSVPAPAPAAAPSIIGTWQIAEMSHNGQSVPMPPGMTMNLTFAEGGALTMNMTGAPEGAGGGNQQGSYTLNGNQITITMQNDTKSGTLTFESNNRAILDMQEMRMVLTR